MKDILLLIGVFAGGYVFTMGLLFAAVKLFFPFKAVEGQGIEGTATILKVSGNTNDRNAAKLRKVRLANG